MPEHDARHQLPATSDELRVCYDLLRRMLDRAIAEHQTVYYHVLSAASSVVHETMLATLNIEREQAHR